MYTHPLMAFAAFMKVQSKRGSASSSTAQSQDWQFAVATCIQYAQYVFRVVRTILTTT